MLLMKIHMPVNKVQLKSIKGGGSTVFFANLSIFMYYHQAKIFFNVIIRVLFFHIICITKSPKLLVLLYTKTGRGGVLKQKIRTFYILAYERSVDRGVF